MHNYIYCIMKKEETIMPNIITRYNIILPGSYVYTQFSKNYISREK